LAHIKLADALIRNGRAAEAIAELEAIQRQEASGTYALDDLGLAYARAHRTNDAEKVLGQLIELQRQGRDHRVVIALMQHLLSDDARALDSLEEALKERADGLENLYTDPLWKDLRPHPRVQAILRRMNLVK